MIDVLSALIGFLIGIVATGFAVELGLKKFFSPPDYSKLTSVWSLTELPSPLISATQLANVNVPKNARVVTATNLQVARGAFDVRKNPEVQGCFAVDANLPRALLFLGGVEKGALALWTVDEKLIERLRAEFNRLWTRSTDYVEHVKLAEILEKANLTVQTEGTVQDIIPYRGHFLLRLTDDGNTVGVLVEKELPVHGKRVSVTGLVRTSSSGYPLVEALEVRST